MESSEILLYIVKLVLGGILAFLAIMLWSRTRDAAWMSLVAGVVTTYAGLAYELFVKLGIILESRLEFFGIPVSSLIFTIVPSIFFILAFILMLFRTK